MYFVFVRSDELEGEGSRAKLIRFDTRSAAQSYFNSILVQPEVYHAQIIEGKIVDVYSYPDDEQSMTAVGSMPPNASAGIGARFIKT